MTVAAERVTWQDVECGGYRADLAMWKSVAAQARRPILELGSGVGRVGLHLARQGHEIYGVDVDDASATELAIRAQEAGLAVTPVVGDACSLQLEGVFDLVLAPMQFLNIVGGARRRAAVLERSHDWLAPGGRFAAAILCVAPSMAPDSLPAPDVREAGGWVYSSLPVDLTVDGTRVEVRRLRQAVSPAGELSEEEHTDVFELLDASAVEAEARRAGFDRVERLTLAPTEEHVGSTVLVLERG
jgi:SAM-dependent methyltransferase